MTTYDYGTGAPPQTGPEGTREHVQQQAQQAASTAADEGTRVADVAKDEARSVASDAQEQARNLLDDARTQLEEQSRGQLDSLRSTLQSFADDLARMTRGEAVEGGLAQDLVSQVGDHARTLTSHLEGREPAELLDQARSFARRRPGTFLLGALAAGVVAGRLARGAKDAQGDPGTTPAPSTAAGSPAPDPVGTSTASMSPAPPAPPAPPTQEVPASPAPAAWPSGTATDDPLAGTGSPTGTPVYPADGPTPGGAL
ncbi:hypothetical protein [Nocardioides sp. MH1]|uniref:hypothetical protein n=1 Tax=Nocardioides sp. MH1 TaxID=3242490 RepID=UPI0035211C2D